MDFNLMFLIWQHFKIWRDVTIVETKGRARNRKKMWNIFKTVFIFVLFQIAHFFFDICHTLLRSPGTGGRPKNRTKILDSLTFAFLQKGLHYIRLSSESILYFECIFLLHADFSKWLGYGWCSKLYYFGHGSLPQELGCQNPA